jgi:branched-chain amino acid transport system permease protein
MTIQQENRSEGTVSPTEGPPPAAGRAVRTGKALLEPGVTLVIAVAAIMYAGQANYTMDYVVLICTYALLALGMYVPYIMSGGLSLAYNAYLGLGAYSCGMVAMHLDVSSVWGVPIGFVLSAVVATLLGLVTRKLSGFYLAGVTLLFAVAFETFLVDNTELTGGPNGIGVLTPTVFGYELDRETMVVIAVLTVWVFGLLLSRLRRSPYGVTLRIKRKVPQVVEAAGVSTSVISLVALAFGAGIASIGGSIFGMMNGFAQPESFGLSVIFIAMFMPLIGGQHTPWGAVLGAALVVVFTFQLTLFEDSGTLLFAIAILLVLRLAPQGILGVLVDAYHWGRRRLGRST